MTPTILPSAITSSAPTPLLAIFSIASYTVWSGVTDHISLPLFFRTELIGSLSFIMLKVSAGAQGQRPVAALLSWGPSYRHARERSNVRAEPAAHSGVSTPN